jgi:hypothetical protein
VHGIFFYNGLGAGLAAACGVRPFLPLLLAGLLAQGKALGVAFAVGKFHFLQSDGWLIAVAGLLAASYAVQILSGQPATLDERSGAGTIAHGLENASPVSSQPLAAALTGLGYGAGALLFAGTLADHRDAWWPGIVGGLLAAAVATRAIGPLISRARRRLPDRAARDALTMYLDGAALVLAAVVSLLHPLGYVVLGLLAILWGRGRARAGDRFAGLRILGR